MKLDLFYHLEYLDYCLHLYCYIHKVLAIFRCFMSNLRAYTEPRTEPFTLSKKVDCSNSVNHDRVQMLSYSKYSLLVLA